MVLALLCSTAASADELSDANKLLENKSYSQALALYTKLAGQGNAVAQYHLGEMYWYGEAGKIDLPKATAWFEKAAAGGNKEAVAALSTMRARGARANEIGYWASSYNGAKLTEGQYSCKEPEFPAVSQENESIKDLTRQYSQWSTCYRGQVEHLRAASTPAKVIPADILALMNQQELDQASAHIDAVNARIAKDTGARAEAVMASYDRWKMATEAYVQQQNKLSLIENERIVQRRQEARSAARIGTAPLGTPTVGR